MALSDADTITLARELFPDVTVASASDAYLTAWLPWARSLVGEPEWGTSYDTGVAMLLAHRGQKKASSSGGGGQGAIKGVSTLGMSVQYGDVAPAGGSALDAWLSSTDAGASWLSMRSSLPDYALPILVDMGGW